MTIVVDEPNRPDGYYKRLEPRAMYLVLVTAIVALFLQVICGPGARASTTELVVIETPRGVSQPFLLIRPDNPEASVILFAGGHGALGLNGASSMTWGRMNFLVRSRDLFAKQGFMVAVVDAPSDRGGGMSASFRMSERHAADIAAIAAYLANKTNVPIWLVGTSMGTFSAARGAIAGSPISGLVLSSTITRSKPGWKIASSLPDAVASMRLDPIRVPTLILSHRFDACEWTPAKDAAKLEGRLEAAAKVAVVMLEGGSPPRSGPCQAESAHGFLGIERRAVDAIADFIRANTR